MRSAKWTTEQLATFRKEKPAGKITRKSKPNRIDLFPDACVQFGLPKPTPEYRFHPTRKWRIDYYFEANGRRVGLEVEGGVWTNGRHTRGKGFAGDMEKYNAAAAIGITIVRVTPGELLKIETFNLVKKTLYASNI